MKVRIALIFSVFCACTSASEPPISPGLEDRISVRPELLYATVDPETAEVVVGGLDGAVEPGLAVTVGAESLVSDPHGRFVVRTSGDVGDIVRVSVDADEVMLTVRDPAQAIQDAVRAPIGGAGNVPNDLIIFGDAESPTAAVVRSGDNAISVYDLQAGLLESLPSVVLPEGEVCGQPRAANPWFIAPISSERVAVTGFGTGSVYIANLGTGALEKTLAAPLQVRLQEAFQLPYELDVDCDRNPESSVTTVAPRTPQGVLVTDSHLVVAYAGFVAPRFGADRPPVYLPSVVATWTLDDLDRAPRTLVLPHLNAQEVVAVDTGDPEDGNRALVTCAGRIDDRSGQPTPLDPGAAYVIDVVTATITRTFELGMTLPGTAVIANDALWVGHLDTAVIDRIALSDESVTSFSINDEAVDSIFRLLPLPGGLLAVPSFNTDRLHIIDTRTNELDPAPFYAPLEVGPGRPVFDGLQIVARRPGRAGIDFVGPDLFCLTGVASRVTPVELRKVLGP